MGFAQDEQHVAGQQLVVAVLVGEPGEVGEVVVGGGGQRRMRKMLELGAQLVQVGVQVDRQGADQDLDRAAEGVQVAGEPGDQPVLFGRGPQREVDRRHQRDHDQPVRAEIDHPDPARAPPTGHGGDRAGGKPGRSPTATRRPAVGRGRRCGRRWCGSRSSPAPAQSTAQRPTGPRRTRPVVELVGRAG